MLRVKIVYTLLISTLALMACAGAQQEPLTLEQKLAEKNYQLGEPVEKIYDYRLDGWNYLDREHVIMHTGPSGHYLVSLRNPCVNLLGAEVIAFTTTVGHLTRYDKLLVKDTTRVLERCYIESLHKLEKIKTSQED